MGFKGRRRCHKGKCHNCGKLSHLACECCSPKKEEKADDEMSKPANGQRTKTKPVRSVNTVMTTDKDADGCWVAKLEPGELGLEDIALINKSDWLYEEDEMVAAVDKPIPEEHGEHIELYDLGATHHIMSQKIDVSHIKAQVQKHCESWKSPCGPIRQ